jgi:hypothetical protein
MRAGSAAKVVLGAVPVLSVSKGKRNPDSVLEVVCLRRAAPAGLRQVMPHRAVVTASEIGTWVVEALGATELSEA